MSLCELERYKIENYLFNARLSREPCPNNWSCNNGIPLSAEVDWPCDETGICARTNCKIGTAFWYSRRSQKALNNNDDKKIDDLSTIGDGEQGDIFTLKESESRKWTRNDKPAQIGEADEDVNFLRVDLLPAYFPLVTSPALRLFIYLASRREGLISYLEIQEYVGIRSKTTIRKSLEELEALGWVELENIDRNEKGQFGSLRFSVLPTPKNLRRDAAELYIARIAPQKARLNENLALIEKLVASEGGFSGSLKESVLSATSTGAGGEIENVTNRQADLEALQARIMACNHCSFSEPFKYFAGSTNARVMVVGQAPNATNTERLGCNRLRAADYVAEWFVQLELDEVQLERDFYFSAVIRCFPGKNPNGGGDLAPPSKAEEACVPYLWEEIKLVQPKLIVAVGRHATEVLLGEAVKLEEVVGECFVRRFGAVETKVVPLPHPSGLNRWPYQHPEKFAQAMEVLKAAVHTSLNYF